MTEAPAPNRYEPIALSNESTVVAEFVRPGAVREARHQSEAELARDFIEHLQAQAYEYLRIGSEADPHRQSVQASNARSTPARHCATRRTSSKPSWIPSLRKPGWTSNGWPSSLSGKPRNSNASLPRKTCTPRRHADSWTTPFAMVASPAQERPSRKCCRPPRALARRPTATLKKTARAAAAGRILGALCRTHLTRKYY